MAKEIKTSLIPNKGNSKIGSFGTASGGNRIRKTAERSVGLFMMLSIVFLALSLVAYAGAYGYRYLLLEELNRDCPADGECGLLISVEQERENVPFEQVARFQELDTKIKAVQGILNSHQSVVGVLEELEENTLHNVRFGQFEFTDDNMVNLSGRAVDYLDLAVQQEVLRENSGINSVVFSDFGNDSEGNITFNLQLQVASELLQPPLN
ncbi:MAG: hypothetical protein ACOCU8_02075 [Patescibacteria group bacterium]